MNKRACLRISYLIFMSVSVRSWWPSIHAFSFKKGLSRHSILYTWGIGTFVAKALPSYNCINLNNHLNLFWSFSGNIKKITKKYNFFHQARNKESDKHFVQPSNFDRHFVHSTLAVFCPPPFPQNLSNIETLRICPALINCFKTM